VIHLEVSGFLEGWLFISASVLVTMLCTHACWIT